MKKFVLCFILLLAGCKNGYTLIRNPEGDEIKIGLVIDEDEKDLIEGIDINATHIYVCSFDCLSKLKELEEEYVDGMVLIGENVLTALENYENINHIPTISVVKQSQFESLKKIYPEYINWMHVTSDNEEIVEADAYYFDEGISVEVDKPFYQMNHSNSMCTLVIDKSKFATNVNYQIDQLIHSNYYSSVLTIEWSKQ